MTTGFYIIFAGCKKLNVAEEEGLNLYSEAGILLFDDDLQDDEWMKSNKTLVLSVTPPVPPLLSVTPPVPPLPSMSSPEAQSSAMPTLKRTNTDDTINLDTTPKTPTLFDDTEVESTPSPKLPTFSTFLDLELKRCGNRKCSSEAFKKV